MHVVNSQSSSFKQPRQVAFMCRQPRHRILLSPKILTGEDCMTCRAPRHGEFISRLVPYSATVAKRVAMAWHRQIISASRRTEQEHAGSVMGNVKQAAISVSHANRSPLALRPRRVWCALRMWCSWS